MQTRSRTPADSSQHSQHTPANWTANTIRAFQIFCPPSGTTNTTRDQMQTFFQLNPSRHDRDRHTTLPPCKTTFPELEQKNPPDRTTQHDVANRSNTHNSLPLQTGFRATKPIAVHQDSTKGLVDTEIAVHQDDHDSKSPNTAGQSGHYHLTARSWHAHGPSNYVYACPGGACK